MYGSRARGDAGPTSDVDVLVFVEDTPAAARKARGLVDGDDDPYGVHHIAVTAAVAVGTAAEIPISETPR